MILVEKVYQYTFCISPLPPCLYPPRILLHTLDRRTHPRVCILACILAEANVRTFVHSFSVLFIRSFISEINSLLAFRPRRLPSSRFPSYCVASRFPDKRNARESSIEGRRARRRFCLRDSVKKCVHVGEIIIVIKLKKEHTQTE